MDRRRVLPLGIVLLLTALLAGCGGSDDSADGGGSTASGQPVVVEHVYGETTVSEVPERIVTIDLQWTDTVLALGVEPVGYTIDSFMPDRTVPWQDLPADAEALDISAGLPLEQIAALRPDLIVGSYSIADQGTYDKLAAIAPTIPNLDETQVTPWQDLVALAGDLLDQPAEASAVVAEVDDAVAATAEELPGLAGRSFALAQYVVGDSMYVVADPADGSTVFFEQLGMVMLPDLVAERERTGEARLNVSTERADLLRADLLAFLVNGGDESDLADIPGFDALPGTVAVLDYPTIVGLNTPTPLSVPYALEGIRPYLEKAAA